MGSSPRNAENKRSCPKRDARSVEENGARETGIPKFVEAQPMSQVEP